MDVIYTDSEGKDISVLNAFTFDLAYGTEENTFELTLDAKVNECTAGSYVYVDRTEYGGIVDNITVDSKKGEIVYSGRTWHGILNSKVVQPDSGHDYYIVTGEANAVIDSLLTKLGLTSLFKASSAVSPVTINNYQFYRYCYAYDGLLAMLNDYDAKLLFSYDGDKVELSVVPAGDYTEFDYNTSEFEFTVEQYFKPINHLICLGQGELAQRQVVHLYVDASGKISTTQTFFGTDEVVGVYDYGNAKDIEELTKEGIKKLKELNNCDTVDIDFNSNDEVYDIGDIVGATDDTTGISVVQKITKKIVTIDDRGAIIKCKIDSGKYSKASLESGKGSASAKDIDDIKALIGTDDISKYGTDVKNAIVEIGSKADNIADDNDEYNSNHNYVVGEYCISPDDGTLQKCVVSTSGGSWATVKDTCFTKDSLTNVVSKLHFDVYNVIADGAGAHNAIYRGKLLGTSVTAEQYASIADGTFKDLFIGDYWIINGVTWRIAAFDYWYNIAVHHVVIVPDKALATCQMNSTIITTGGYVGSDFYTGANGNTGRATAISAVNSAFGAAHILHYNDYLINAVTDGHPSGQVRQECTVELMNESMVYGGKLFEPMANGTAIYSNYTVSKSQLPLFQHDHSRICNRAAWWLRGVVSSAAFAAVYGNGSARYSVASDSIGVRPAFAIRA